MPLLGSSPVADGLPVGDAPEFQGFVCIPSPVPNPASGLMIIDLADYVDNNITEIINLVSLPQGGYPKSVTFVPMNVGITRSPSNGALQALGVYVKSWVLPIALETTVYTASGDFQTFRTC
jgi:hypothetical protein